MTPSAIRAKAEEIESKLFDMPFTPIKRVELIESALLQVQAAERKRFSGLCEAARGLSFGTDWNNGTHAKLHGYRDKLLKALNDLEIASDGAGEMGR